MQRNLLGNLVLLSVLLSLAMMTDVAWAFKNSCPICQAVIKNQDLTACPTCGKIINKCLICGKVNPIKNDNCDNCSATLSESRVQRTIAQSTRDDLQLGESPRARIEVELRQIEEEASNQGLSAEMAARQVELLTQMGWWSKANTLASEFTAKFPEAEQTEQVAACRVTALRHLGFLALDGKKKRLAREYLKTALAIDPKDEKSRNLLQMAGGSK